ncbi:MAG: glutamate-1-semialdehyde 2,1-aminomutase [Bacteroidota bacterium]
MNTPRSDSLFEQARNRIPGGVNSPVRAFKSVGRNPIFIAKASGSRFWDVDGNEYIDYIGSWGPMIHGHCHPLVMEALQDAIGRGTSYGAPTELEVRMAELICSMVPSMEMVRMVNSGTEATMSAIRLARAYTKREKVVKFEGCYHGHGDSFLIKAGSGALTLGIPDSPGVLPAVAAGTLTATFNDLSSVEALAKEHRGNIAAIIIEPVVGNMGCVPPTPGFLEGLRTLCTREGILLIFDEVMTGFRLAKGGAQELYGIAADLTTLGKIIGGGLPVGAYGGKREIMELVAPSGPMYQAGTLSGNPLAMTAGLVSLSILNDDPGFYKKLEEMAMRLEKGLSEEIRRMGIPVTINRVGSMFTLFFTTERVTDYTSAVKADTKKFALYFRAMLDQGIYLAPSQFEAAFLSAAHSKDDIDRTVEAHDVALRAAFG